LLGPPEVRVGAKLLTFPTRKTLALLIYLALEGGEQPREHLAALLWPESSPARSHASLRNTLGHLQSALRRASRQAQTSFLSVTHNALALNPDAHIHLDLHTVERAYALARADRSSRKPPKGSASLPMLQSAAACHRGDFLAGFSLGNAPGFDDWAAVQREAWRRRLGLILDRLSEIQFARGEFAATAEIAATWIALDTLNEVAYRRKMRAHFAAGERGQALETYRTCRALLATELQAARMLTWKAADAKGRQERITLEASMAKLAASEAAHKAADKAMQILASAGYRRGSVVERLFRDVRATEIYQGTSEAQRMIVAAQVLAGS